MSLQIRWMIRRDLAEVLEIEWLCFRFPWGERDFIRSLRHTRTIGLVMEESGAVVAYALYELGDPYDLERSPPCITNLAVIPRLHDRGLGRRLVEDISRRLLRNKRDRLEVFVADFNLDAQHFFAACGFRALGVARDHYEEPIGDAVRFCRRLTERAEAAVAAGLW